MKAGYVVIAIIVLVFCFGTVQSLAFAHRSPNHDRGWIIKARTGRFAIMRPVPYSGASELDRIKKDEEYTRIARGEYNDNELWEPTGERPLSWNRSTKYMHPRSLMKPRPYAFIPKTYQWPTFGNPYGYDVGRMSMI